MGSPSSDAVAPVVPFVSATGREAAAARVEGVAAEAVMWNEATEDAAARRRPADAPPSKAMNTKRPVPERLPRLELKR
jgi:hypothetical protein